MHLILFLLLLLCLAPGPAAAQPLEFGGIPLTSLTASSYLDTSWPNGYGPRLPAPLAAKKALTAPIPPQSFAPALALDDDPETAWVPRTSGVEAWLRMELSEPAFVNEVSIRAGGSLSGEDSTENSFIQSLTVSDPASETGLPPRVFELEATDRPQEVNLYGHVYRSVSLTLEQLHVGPSGRMPVSSIDGSVLPISPSAVSKALELPDAASMSAVKNPARGGEYVVAWSGLVDGRLAAEMVGVAGRGDAIRILWREPVDLQWRGARSVDLLMEPVSFGGPPSLLLTYRFNDSGATLAFARVYVMTGSGAFPAWETSLIGDLRGLTRQSLKFSGGRAYISEFDEDLGHAMTQRVFRYDPNFRQFEPAPNQQPGVSTSITTPSGSVIGSTSSLYDGVASKGILVSSDGVGTTVTLRFAQPRRISAIKLLPGTTALSTSGRPQGYTRPSTVTLTWPNGHSIDAELEDAAELQTLFEGWDGPASQPTDQVSIRVTGVYPAVPGDKMAISELEVFFLDPP